MRKTILRIAIVTAIAAVMLAGSPHPSGAADTPAAAPVFPPSFADLADRVKPAVVNISTTATVRVPGNPFRHFFGPEGDPFGDFFRRHFGDVPDREMKRRSLGSGFILDRQGLIVTNNHVVAAGAENIKVRMGDGREFKAEIIGRDAKTDLALIRIESPAADLPALALGDSGRMRVGDWVMAVGNPFGLEQTVTTGIVSATGRVIGAGPYDDFIQTDAPINPGNSGGPLVNMRGEVIGINTAIVAMGQGLGFAIPSNLAAVVIAQLKEKGQVTRGWIGITIQAVTPDIAGAMGLKDTRGALVSSVVAGSPAERAGIKQGDVIIAFDGKEIRDLNDLPRIVADTPVGKQVNVDLLRDGKKQSPALTVAEMKEDGTSPAEGPAVEFPGMEVAEITPQLAMQLQLEKAEGVIVTRVRAGSPAEDAGIRRGDVIVEFNRQPVRDMKDYREALRGAGKADRVLVLLERQGRRIYTSIRLP